MIYISSIQIKTKRRFIFQQTKLPYKTKNIFNIQKNQSKYNKYLTKKQFILPHQIIKSNKIHLSYKAFLILFKLLLK